MRKTMKAIAFLMLLPAFLHAGQSAAGQSMMSISSFDINAYLEEPLVGPNQFYVNVFDTISMRAGALAELSTSSTAALTDSSYINVNSYLTDLFGKKGLAIATVECRGTNSYGSLQNLQITLSLHKPVSAGGALVPSTGLVRVDSDPSAGEPPVLGVDINLVKDKFEYADKTKKIDANTLKFHGDAENNDNLSGLNDVSKTYSLSSDLGQYGTLSGAAEWEFVGNIRLKAQKSKFDSLPMGSYKALVKIQIRTIK